MHRVFVYGTLKRGYPNFDGNMDAARFVGDFRTCERYPLVVGGPWCSVYLLDEPGQGHQVRGEVFEIDDEALKVLDRLEATHLPDGYRRVECATEALDGAETSRAWVYLRQRRHVDGIHETLADFYPQEARYIPPWKRPEA
jgi:gamma-glutamylaminecyclotransferase